MPELPEVEVLCRRLEERTRGKRIEELQLASISALKTFDPPLQALRGQEVARVVRRGKYVCLDASGLWLVVHLARSGWVRWREAVSSSPPRQARSPLALRVRLETGQGFEITEMATEKRLALYVTASPDEIESVKTLGTDPLDPSFSPEQLGLLLAREKGDLKHALSHQSIVAGIGNAYSDEALHAAKLSPFKPAAKLSPEELESLHGAVTGVLTAAIERASLLDIEGLKDGKRTSMRVHGRTGQPCPVCGDTVREVSFSTRSLQYCATCQTGGKPLADRRLSRLLK